MPRIADSEAMRAWGVISLEDRGMSPESAQCGYLVLTIGLTRLMGICQADEIEYLRRGWHAAEFS